MPRQFCGRQGRARECVAKSVFFFWRANKNHKEKKGEAASCRQLAHCHTPAAVAGAAKRRMSAAAPGRAAPEVAVLMACRLPASVVDVRHCHLGWSVPDNTGARSLVVASPLGVHVFPTFDVGRGWFGDLLHALPGVDGGQRLAARGWTPCAATAEGVVAYQRGDEVRAARVVGSGTAVPLALPEPLGLPMSSAHNGAVLFARPEGEDAARRRRWHIVHSGDPKASFRVVEPAPGTDLVALAPSSSVAGDALLAFSDGVHVHVLSRRVASGMLISMTRIVADLSAPVLLACGDKDSYVVYRPAGSAGGSVIVAANAATCEPLAYARLPWQPVSLLWHDGQLHALTEDGQFVVFHMFAPVAWESPVPAAASFVS